MILPFGPHVPAIGEDCFIAPDAWVIGQSVLAQQVSVFFGASVRGDIEAISIGAGTNIQEHSLIHTSRGRSPAIVGANCTIGHRAIVHGCTIGSRCLVGMGAIILDDTIVEDECIIAAGTVLSEKKRIPARSMVMGVPGKVVRSLRDEEVEGILKNAEHYRALGKSYRELLANKSS